MPDLTTSLRNPRIGKYESVARRAVVPPCSSHLDVGDLWLGGQYPCRKGVPAVITKSKVSMILFLSMLPAFGACTVAVVMSPGDGVESNWNTLGAFSTIYFVFALVVGVILYWWGKRDDTYVEAHQYAERHGWHPISKYMWRSRKREGAALSVNRAYKKSTYILTIEHQGETTTVDEFDRADWAMQFGDWLWEELRVAGQTLDVQLLREKRDEWEQSQALAKVE